MKTVLAALFVLLGTSAVTPSLGEDAFEQNRRLGRGVNVIGYDPIWRARDQARFQEKHFRLLKEAGFSSVRINLHPFRHMTRERDWALRDPWFETLDWAVKHATTHGTASPDWMPTGRWIRASTRGRCLRLTRWRSRPTAGFWWEGISPSWLGRRATDLAG